MEDYIDEGGYNNKTESEKEKEIVIIVRHSFFLLINLYYR